MTSAQKAGRGHLVLVPSEFEQGLLRFPEGPERERFACGIGPVAAALETTLLLSRRQPSHCWLVGLAGTRDTTRIPVGSVVVGEAVRNQAVGAGAGGSFLDLAGMGLEGDGPGQPDLLPLNVPADADLQRARTTLAAAMGGVADQASRDALLQRVVIGTVAAASIDPEASAAWAERHPDVLVEEMEGWAVAIACRRAGVPLTILRGVSNVCGDRDLSGWRTVEAMQALDLTLAALFDDPAPPS